MPTHDGSGPRQPDVSGAPVLLRLYGRDVRDRLAFIASRLDLSDTERAAFETVRAVCDRIAQ